MTSLILIIDDEPMNLQVIAEILEPYDYNLLYAPTGKKGIEIAEERLPDAIIMDWDMPGLSGIETTKILKQLEDTCDIPILIATGKVSTPDDLEKSLASGAVDFLRKPIVDSELVARLNSAIQISNSIKLIKEQNNAIKTSLNYAVDIQRSMLPKNEDFDNYFDTHFILDSPKEVIKGDIFWLRSNLNGQVLLVLIDSGPSVSGALLSTMINLSLQRIVDENDFLESHILLGKINGLLAGEIKTSPGGRGVKISVCLLDYNESTFQFAGHRNSLFVFKNKALVNLFGENDHDEISHKSYKIRYTKGDRFYLISNGWSNQHGGSEKEPYGHEKQLQFMKEFRS